MKKTTIILTFVFCLGLLFLSNGYGTCIWDTTKAQLDSGQTAGVGFVYSGKFYIVGGTVPPNVNSGRMQMYDPAMDSWTNLAPMPTPRHWLTGAVVDTMFYTIGGGPSTIIEAYHPALNTWSTKSPMPTSRGMISSAVLHDSLIFVLGGWSGSSTLNTVEAYNTRQDTWMTGYSPLQVVRSNGGAVSINNEIYIFGGGNSGTIYNTTEKYDPDLDTWVYVDTMNASRANFSYGVINGKIYVMGGTTQGGGYLNSIEVYDPDADTWTLLDCTNLHPRFGSEFAVFDNSMYIASGQSQIPVTDWSSYFDIFTPIEIDSFVVTSPFVDLVGPGEFPGDTVLIPVYLNAVNYGTGPGIYSFQYELLYNDDLFECIGYDSSGTILGNYGGLSSFTVEFRKDSSNYGISHDTLRFAAANDDSLYYPEVPGTAFEFPRVLTYLKFRISPTIMRGDTTPLLYSKVLLNEGNPGVSGQFGSLTMCVRKVGDVDHDYNIYPADAAIVLRNVIRDTTIAPPLCGPLPSNWPLEVADVTGNGEITAYDASLILQYYVGKISEFPAGTYYKNSLPSNQSVRLALEWGEVHDGIITLALSADGLAEVFASSFELLYDNTALEYLGTNLTEFTHGMTNVETVNDDRIRFAMAGTEPLNGTGPLALMRFRLKGNTGSEELVQLLNALLNEEVVWTSASATGTPKTYALEQNYPNPFNPTTRIRYQIPETAQVQITIYNLLGQKVRTLVSESQPVGAYEITWDGTNNSGVSIASGVYIYRITAESFVQTRKMIFMK